MGFSLTGQLADDYDAVVVTVPHAQYKKLDDSYFAGITKPTGPGSRSKGIFRGKISSRDYWSL
jgi:UDP-N-acetyl-D-galactosamine dehydrogenase